MTTWKVGGRDFLSYIKIEYAMLLIKLLIRFSLFPQTLLDMPPES